jgi:iron complex outermembrane receptor protein
MRRSTYALAAATGAWLTAAPTLALPAPQAESSPATGAREDSARLDEIVVTAQRRAQSVQDVPIAVTAFSAEELAVRQIETTTDIGQNVPGVFTRRNTGSQQAGAFYIRGIGQGNQISTLEPGIGLYIDDVYIARTVFAARPLLDLERVEVLRGPQGTLYGRNATGGAIKLYSAMPGLERETQLEGSFGNFERYTAALLHNQPLADTVSLKIAASAAWQDEGFQDVQGSDRDANAEDSASVRMSLRFLPSERFDWVLRADWTDLEADGTYGSILSDGPQFLPDGTLVATGSFDEDELKRVAAPFPLANEVTDWGASSHATWRFGELTFSSITGYRDDDNDILIDFSGAGLLVGVTGKFRQFSQEFQLQNRAGSALDWTLGAFYLGEDNDSVNSLTVPTVLALANRVQNETDAAAVFGQLTWSVTEAFRLGAGLRYTDEQKTLDIAQTFNGIPTFDTATIIANGVDVDRDFSELSPSAQIEYDIDPDIMVYATYSEGFKSGGWSTLLTGPTTTRAFDAETVRAIELGLKSELFADRLRLNAAAFFNGYDELQLEDVDSAGQFFATNVGEAEIRGLELEANAVLWERLDVFAHYSYLDTEVTEGGRPGSGLDRGDVLANAPENQWQLGVNFRPAFGGDGEWLLRATWNHRDEYFNDSQNNPLQLMDETDLVDALVRFDARSGWYAQAACKNCTDELYVVGRFSGPPGFPAYAGARRHVDLTVGVRF